jgi:hypothetical protein
LPRWIPRWSLQARPRPTERRFDYPAGAGIAAIAVADLTRDGRPDVAVSAALSNTVRVLRATCLP